MSIAHEILDQLHDLLGSSAPRVKALHLPPPDADGREAEFGALELEDGSLGMSFLLLGDTLAELRGGAALPGRPGADALRGMDALALARQWRDAHGAQRALGFAAVNALSRHLFDRWGFVPPRASDSIGGLDPRPGEHIGMVGLFTPLLRQVTEHGARLTVLELRAELAGRHPGYEVTVDRRVLRTCDKVLCTSTVLLNDTLDDVLAQCQRARAIAMIGPGAGCLPDALFRRGVTLLGGSWIVDRAAFLDALRSGQPWGRHAFKFALEPAGYTGGTHAQGA